jgi:hypothetical protein
MNERVGLEVDTLTIRMPIRLQRRAGRKLIMTPEGVTAPARKPSRDETLVKALVRAHRWRRKIESGQARSITDLAEQEGGRLRLPAPAAHLLGAGHCGGDPRWAAAEGAEAGRDAGERTGWLGGAAAGFRLSLTGAAPVDDRGRAAPLRRRRRRIERPARAAQMQLPPCPGVQHCPVDL